MIYVNTYIFVYLYLYMYVCVYIYIYIYIYIYRLLATRVTTQNLAFLSYRYRRNFADALLTGIVSYRSLQNWPLESSCVVVALIEKYSTIALQNLQKLLLKDHRF